MSLLKKDTFFVETLEFFLLIFRINIRVTKVSSANLCFQRLNFDFSGGGMRR